MGRCRPLPCCCEETGAPSNRILELFWSLRKGPAKKYVRNDEIAVSEVCRRPVPHAKGA